MFEFSKTYQMQSVAFSGVVVTLRRIGPKERGELEMKLAGPRTRQREVGTAIEHMEARIDAALSKCEKYPEDHAKAGQAIESEVPQEILDLGSRWQSLTDKYAALTRAEIDTEFVKAAVVSITELTFEGEPATAQMVCDYGPESLFAEIANAIMKNAYLSPEQSANFKLPSTSGADANGKATLTIAKSAKRSGSTRRETVAATSPSS